MIPSVLASGVSDGERASWIVDRRRARRLQMNSGPSTTASSSTALAYATARVLPLIHTSFSDTVYLVSFKREFAKSRGVAATVLCLLVWG